LRAAGGQPVQPPPQGNAGQPIQQPNPYQPTYGIWSSVRLEFRLLPPTRLPQLATDCRRTCTV
jgi:hypothetical protein